MIVSFYPSSDSGPAPTAASAAAFSAELIISLSRFQRDDGRPGAALARSADPPALDALIAVELILNRFARHAGARAVNDPDRADPRDDGVVEIFIDDFQTVLNVATDDVAFRFTVLARGAFIDCACRRRHFCAAGSAACLPASRSCGCR